MIISCNIFVYCFALNKLFVIIFRELRDFHQRYESLVYSMKDKDDLIKELQNQLDARQSCKSRYLITT